MNPQDSVKIARDGVPIGEWTPVEISQFLASGSIQPMDLFYDGLTNAWRPLLPAFHRKCHEYDWVNTDSPWYYVLDGQIVGPRSSAEIDALVASGYLKPDTWLSHICAEKWFQCSELAVLAEASRAAADHAKEAFNKLLSGDKAGAVQSGWNSLKRFLADAESNAEEVTRHLAIQTDQEGYPGDQRVLAHIKSAGFDFTAHQRFEGSSGNVLVVQFADKDEALAVESVLSGTTLTPHYRLQLEFTKLGIG